MFDSRETRLTTEGEMCVQRGIDITHTYDVCAYFVPALQDWRNRIEGRLSAPESKTYGSRAEGEQRLFRSWSGVRRRSPGNGNLTGEMLGAERWIHRVMITIAISSAVWFICGL